MTVTLFAEIKGSPRIISYALGEMSAKLLMQKYATRQLKAQLRHRLKTIILLIVDILPITLSKNLNHDTTKSTCIYADKVKHP